ncbi:hypothetical protein [Stappia indica]|uniref:hypothetical protein n=1 Tax=Stappia indica TaxID=538381 RepID=UPI001CD3A5BA|nr:hypothetical protein [Stappia indica]MCA1300570.1 hypothetical protein [Stappia indica]
MDVILVINAGSSSLKFQVFTIADEEPERRIKGQIDGMSAHPRLHAATADGTDIIEQIYTMAEFPDLPAATRELTIWLHNLEGFTLRAIGHRIVHGGPEFSGPMLINEGRSIDSTMGFPTLDGLNSPEFRGHSRVTFPAVVRTRRATASRS